MIAILDVSGVIEIILQKEKAYQFKQVLEEAELVITPDLFVSELTNVIWKYVRSKLISQEQGIQHIVNGVDYIDNFCPCSEFWREAFVDSVQFEHSAYDMFYFSLAKKHNAVLVTNDKVLAELCQKNNVPCCF
jgi:predicted nucleic acid-binding protein